MYNRLFKTRWTLYYRDIEMSVTSNETIIFRFSLLPYLVYLENDIEFLALSVSSLTFVFKMFATHLLRY